MNETRARLSVDHALRAEIDELVSSLSPAGKLELAARLTLDGVRELVTERLDVLPATTPIREAALERAATLEVTRGDSEGSETRPSETTVPGADTAPTTTEAT